MDSRDLQPTPAVEVKGIAADAEAFDLLVELLDLPPTPMSPQSGPASDHLSPLQDKGADPLQRLWRPLLEAVVRSALVDGVVVLRDDRPLAWAGLSDSDAVELSSLAGSRPTQLLLAQAGWHAAWQKLDRESDLVVLRREPLPELAAQRLSQGLARLLRLHEQADQLFQRERRALEQVQAQVSRDPLTGLPNRVRALDHLEDLLQQEQSGREQGTVVLFIDLDNFKLINDAYGHRVGDCFLITCSKIMQKLVRPCDLVARLAGDEFIIICRDCSLQQAQGLADQLIEQISRPMTIGTCVISHSASVGIAVVGAQERARTVIENADLAMMQAKQQGRGRASRYDLQLRTSVKERASLEDSLRQAIRQQEIRCVYQPIVRLPHGQISGFEALARWHHPRQGLISPEVFIPVAEASGQIADLDAQIIREACASLASWRRRFPVLDLHMSANISARTLRDPKIASRVEKVLHAFGIGTDSLYLEITETMLVDNIDTAARTLETLRNLGLKLAIDDFGTGYSSLRYLREFPVGFLKIDKSFVDGLGEGGHDDVIVAAVLQMAASLGLEVIAEGVECREQAILLDALGCRYAQGYLFGRPVEAASAQALLEGQTL